MESVTTLLHSRDDLVYSSKKWKWKKKQSFWQNCHRFNYADFSVCTFYSHCTLQILWEDKCLPDSTFYILYGYHVVFNGQPIKEDIQTTTTEVVTTEITTEVLTTKVTTEFLTTEVTTEVFTTEITAEPLPNLEQNYYNSKVSNIIHVPYFLFWKSKTPVSSTMWLDYLT